jgi:hypothetical protein
MTSFAHVMLRDCNRHICFIRTGTSAIEKRNTKNRATDAFRLTKTISPNPNLLDRKFPHAHLQFKCDLRPHYSRDTCDCCEVAPTAQGSMKKDDQP